MTCTLLAIDPGKTGALAWTDSDGEVFDLNMPDTAHELAFELRALAPARVVMEKVGFHVQGNNASASAKFARHVGQIEGVLATLGIPFEQVTPQRWMSALCGSLPKDKAERKRAIQTVVEQRIGHTVTVRNADAVGILLWANGVAL